MRKREVTEPQAPVSCAWCKDSFGDDEPPPIGVGPKKGVPRFFLHEECIRAFLLACRGVES